MARTPDEMANELDNSDVEVGGQMAEDLMDPPQGDPQEPEVKTPEPEAAPPPQKPVSFLSDLDDTEDEGEPAPATKAPSATPGMIRDIQREREHRKAAEQQAADLKRQLDELQAVQQATPDIDLNTVLGEGEDDDFVDRKTLKQVVEATARKTREITLQEFQQREQAVQAKAAKQQREQAMSASETAIRGTVGDYDAVVQQALELNVLSLDDKRQILSSPNPAGTLYFKAKQVLSSFGIPVSPPPAALPVDGKPPKQQENVPSGEDVLSDDELYSSLFAKT